MTFLKHLFTQYCAIDFNYSLENRVMNMEGLSSDLRNSRAFLLPILPSARILKRLMEVADCSNAFILISYFKLNKTLHGV